MFTRTLRIFVTAAAFSGILAGASFAGTLRVGGNIGNLPWEFENANGKIVGFEVDLIDKVALILGDKVEITNIPFNGLFSAVESGRIDLAISSITITKKRLKSVSFAQPYYDSDQSLSVVTGGPSSLAEMAGKVVGVETGSTGDLWAMKHQKEYNFAKIRRYVGLAPAMLDLQAGRIDGYISDIPAVQYYIKDKPYLKIVKRIKTGERYSMMFKKGSELASKVNDVLTKLKHEGFIAGLYKKWFGATPEDSTSTVKVYPMPKAD